jgi:hypothetical protein
MSLAHVLADPRLQALAARFAPAGADEDPAAVCARQGIRLTESDLASMLAALYFPDIRTVVLNSNPLFGPKARRFAFWHEIAHQLVGDGIVAWGRGRNEERFCDAFACAVTRTPPELVEGRPLSQLDALLAEGHVMAVAAV